MGELQPARDVADGIDLAVAGAQSVIDLDTRPCAVDPRRLKVQALDIGLAPGGHQKVGAGKDLSGFRDNLDRAVCAPDLGDHRLFADIDAFGLQGIQHDCGGLGVILAQCLQALDHRHFAAQPDMRLRHFHTDGAAADDQQVIGLFTQVKDGLVGVERHRLQTRDRRHKRR